MDSMKQWTSSRSNGVMGNAGVDERKRKKMISNRESAKRSRMRKQQHIEGLISKVTQLQNDNKLIEEKITSASNMYTWFASQNNVMRAQLAELTDRLHSLKSVLQIAEEVVGFAVDIPEIPDTLFEPWQLPCPLQTVVDSASMF